MREKRRRDQQPKDIKMNDCKLHLEALLHQLSTYGVCEVEFEGEIQSCETHISETLTKVYDVFRNATTLDTALTSLPEAGQLIGKLCMSKYIKGNQKLYEQIARCIITLYKERPVTALEMTAKEFALDKMRLMLNIDAESLLPACRLGASFSDVGAQYLDVAIQVTSKQIHKISEGETDLKRKENDIINKLQNITTFLFCVPQSRQFSKIWEDVIDLLSTNPSLRQNSNILDELTRSQLWSISCRESFLYLSESTLEKFYMVFRPAVEQEILLTIQASRHLQLLSNIRNVIASRPLFRICARNEILKITVKKIFYKVFVDIRSSDLLSIADAFNLCVQDNRIESQDRQDDSHWNMYSSLPLCSLQLHLSKPCKEIPEIETGIKSVVDCLLSLQPLDKYLFAEKRFLLVTHTSWYYGVLKTLFIGNTQVISDCIKVIVIYHSTKETDKINEELLRSVVSRLRQLMSLAVLRKADIMRAISPIYPVMTDVSSLWKTILSHILVTFMYFADNGVVLADMILKLVISVQRPKDYLSTMLIAHERLNINFKSWPASRLHSYRAYIKQLVDGVEEADVSNELINASHSFINGNDG